MTPVARVFALAALGATCSGTAWAEPYLAVREGLRCAQCHANPTGGGLRTAFGNAYARSVLAAEPAEAGAEAWSEALGDLVNLGGDLRTSASYVKVPHQGTSNAFETQEFRLYLAANVIPNRLVIHADQRIAPGGSGNQEAYARLALGAGRYYVKAGQMYLAYGLRLEDDTALVREVPGINMTTPDNGVEVGADLGAWSLQAAVSNGTAGGPETDDGKQATLRAEFVQPAWRIGASVSHNEAEAGARRMAAAFAGVRTGPVAWLAEGDWVEDDSVAGGALLAGLLEANWAWRQGHNLKLTGEYHDPDVDTEEDHSSRTSVVWEYTPLPFLQLRSGLRFYEDIPQDDLQNRRVAFGELHAFF